MPKGKYRLLPNGKADSLTYMDDPNEVLPEGWFSVDTIPVEGMGDVLPDITTLNTDEYKFKSAQDEKLASIDAAIEEYLGTKPNGNQRYTQKALVGFLCNLQIMSDQDKRDKINSVLGWMGRVQQYYLQVRGLVSIAGNLDQLSTITWDFTQFEASDPDVSLADL